MTAVLDFLAGIGDGIKSAVEFLLSMIEDIAYMVQLLGEFVSKIPEYLSFLPAPVLAIFVSMFSIVVIYKILGRE